MNLEEVPGYIDLFRLIVLPALILINWALSFAYSKTGNFNWKADSLELWSESKPFLKQQIIFVVLIIAGTALSYSSFYATANQPPWLAIAESTGAQISGILELFYLSYLGSRSGRPLIPTIGIWSIFKLSIGQGILTLVTMAAFAALVIPGVILCVRVALFLPAYALQGQHLGTSVKRSWILTSGHYWATSRYLSPVVFAWTVINSIAYITLSASPERWQSLGAISYLVTVVFGMASVATSLLWCGLSYKLYKHLADERATQLDAHSTVSA